jgi:hypothetical protein
MEYKELLEIFKESLKWSKGYRNPRKINAENGTIVDPIIVYDHTIVHDKTVDTIVIEDESSKEFDDELSENIDNPPGLGKYVKTLKESLKSYQDTMDYLNKTSKELENSLTHSLNKRGLVNRPYPVEKYTISRIVKNYQGKYSLLNEFKNLKESIEYTFYLPVSDTDKTLGHYAVAFFMTIPKDSKEQRKFNIIVFAVETPKSGNGEKSMDNLFDICKQNNAVIFVHEIVPSSRKFWGKMKERKIIKDYSYVEEIFRTNTKYSLLLDVSKEIKKYRYVDEPFDFEKTIEIPDE